MINERIFFQRKGMEIIIASKDYLNWPTKDISLMQRNNLNNRKIFIFSGSGINAIKLITNIIKWKQFQGSLK